MTSCIAQVSKRLAEWRGTSFPLQNSQQSLDNMVPNNSQWLLSDYCIQFKTHISLSKSLTPRARIHGSAAPKSFYLLISGSPELSFHLSSNEHCSISNQLLRAVVPEAWGPEWGDTAGSCDGTNKGNLILGIVVKCIPDWQTYEMVYSS